MTAPLPVRSATRLGIAVCAHLADIGARVRSAHSHTGQVHISAEIPPGIDINATGAPLLRHVHIHPSTTRRAST